jgi:hypothetical protein
MLKTGLFVIALTAAGPLSADPAAIGMLGLTNLNGTGFQAVTFMNFTGVDQGCQVNGSDFSVCTGVTVTNWTLTLTFTNQNPANPSPSYGSYTSPLVFNWQSSADDIGIYDPSPSVNNGYGFTGGASGTWQIPLHFGGQSNTDEPPCPAADTSEPSCDYQITQVEFSGEIAAVDSPFQLGQAAAAGGNYDPSDPSTYAIFAPQLTFDTIWNVPQSDYYNMPFSDPQLFGDGVEVLADQAQATTATVPEPGTLWLFGAVLVGVAFRRKQMMKGR